MFLWLACITGIAYPLLITIIAQVTMSKQANGSFLSNDNRLIGSTLIGQKFTSNQYFWPRPSAVDYNPLPSDGSNLAPTNIKLQAAVKEREKIIAQTHAVIDNAAIPSELLYASGSGLDPHISIKAALFQLQRVAQARHLDESTKQKIQQLILDLATPRYQLLFGPSYVNVLELNYHLDMLIKRI